MPEPVDLTFVSSDVFGGEWLQWGDSFTGLDDLVKQIEAKLKPGECIRRLVIAAHGAERTDGFTVFDPDVAGTEYVDGSLDEPMSPETRAKLEKLKAFFCNEAVLELRVCRFGTDEDGDRALQAVADAVGVPVTAPMDEISSLALIGGLATDWKTAHPSHTGKPIEETFTRGDPEVSMTPEQGSGIAPVTGATVPLPAVNKRPPGTAPATPPASTGIAPVTGGTVTQPPPMPDPPVVAPPSPSSGADIAPVTGGTVTQPPPMPDPPVVAPPSPSSGADIAPVTGSTVTSARTTSRGRGTRGALLGVATATLVAVAVVAWNAFGGSSDQGANDATPSAGAPVTVAGTSVSAGGSAAGGTATETPTETPETPETPIPETAVEVAPGIRLASGDAPPEGYTRVEVLVIGGEHYPVAQFRVGGPDACPADHWHSGVVYSLEGSSLSDPNPPECGHGRVGEVPEETVDVSAEVMAEFRARTGG